MSDVKRYSLRPGVTMPATAALFLPDVVVSASDFDALQQRCRGLENENARVRDHSQYVAEGTNRIGAALTSVREALGLPLGDSLLIDLVPAIDALRDQVEALRKDKDLLDAIEVNCWDVRFSSSPNADAGDSSISIEIIGHYMAEPHERVVGENYHENLRAALCQAMTADDYPPARPEYDEDEAIDAAMEVAP